mmetsp:Transcript_32591/g.112200  ORF Transcript_32591/g.112200 Transcript_32591/m.112200 type:complete len:353 (+) Transcript_32591:646-1704(+)
MRGAQRPDALRRRLLPRGGVTVDARPSPRRARFGALLQKAVRGFRRSLRRRQAARRLCAPARTARESALARLAGQQGVAPVSELSRFQSVPRLEQSFNGLARVHRRRARAALCRARGARGHGARRAAKAAIHLWALRRGRPPRARLRRRPKVAPPRRGAGDCAVESSALRARRPKTFGKRAQGARQPRRLRRRRGRGRAARRSEARLLSGVGFGARRGEPRAVAPARRRGGAGFDIGRRRRSFDKRGRCRSALAPRAGRRRRRARRPRRTEARRRRRRGPRAGADRRHGRRCLVPEIRIGGAVRRGRRGGAVFDELPGAARGPRLLRFERSGIYPNPHARNRCPRVSRAAVG